MVHCISCERFPADPRQVPYDFVGSADTFKVKLLSDTMPNPLPTSGADVVELNSNVYFAIGSTLHVLAGSKIYVYGENGFQEWKGEMTDFEIDSDGTVHR